MAPLRTSQARTRPRRSVHKAVNGYVDSDFDLMASTPIDDGPPPKRMRTSRSATTTRSRWIPGGRGGGGRHIDVDDVEASTPTPKVVASPRPRGRPRKDANKTTPLTTPRISARSANRPTVQRPRYSTAAAATAAAAHGDGYKPREERGWEEFHPDLDLEADFAVIASEEVDGIKKAALGEGGDQDALIVSPRKSTGSASPMRKRGRPLGRRTDSMLQSLLSPETPKVVPLPGPNPRERLTLPKPSFRELDPFTAYEGANGVNYVDKTMANVGYQESEVFLRPERAVIRQTEGSAEEDLDLSPDLLVGTENSAIGSTGVGRVEYDMDEQDVKWLNAFNRTRIAEGAGPIKPAIFEVTMTKIEKEWHALEKRIPKPNPKAPQTQRPRSSSAAAVNGEPAGEEGDTKCAICDDGDCENANAIVFCDGCDLAVHQECYGVIHIPEGQWLCRKCSLVGNARPSCIFCPHEGGAFKQTNNAKWAHLFCAIWIPEVTIGNPSLMEPITDVEKVPPSRWKLLCYICNQAMGAGIQCSDGRCYRAFHLTCARKGGLYLRMKTGGGQNTLMDQSLLRSYCHQHSPNDWKADHNTDRAYETTVKHCKEHFKGQLWADSRSSALAVETPTMGGEKGPLKVTLTNKKGQKQKTIWKLPSGAPVIPEVILKSIEESLVRFSVHKKKEYVSELCKYWTLKREARRGAALLKRLQLQMDTFSSFEVTRRDYKAQGAAGRARLDRRIEFAEILEKDLERIRQICETVKQREAEKLAEARLLKDLVDIVYFPIPPLLDPIIEKAIKHDKDGIYRHDLHKLRSRAKQGDFTTVTSFSKNFAQIFADRLQSDAVSFAEIIQQVSGRAEDDIAPERRELRSRARYILRATQPFLEDAIRKESELTGRPFAQQMKELEQALISRHESVAESTTDEAMILESIENMNGGATPDVQDVEMQDADVDQENINPAEVASGHSTKDHTLTVPSTLGTAANTPPPSTNGIIVTQTATEQADPNNTCEPPTPPISLEGQGIHPALGGGGIPWYVEAFDPFGTTIYDERWTGQQVLREMSEELSEMDEDELQGLGPDDSVLPTDVTLDSMIVDEADALPADGVGGAVKKGKGAKGRRSGNNWSGRSARSRRWR